MMGPELGVRNFTVMRCGARPVTREEIDAAGPDY